MDLTDIGGQHRPVIAQRDGNRLDPSSAKQQRNRLRFAFACDHRLEMLLLLLTYLATSIPRACTCTSMLPCTLVRTCITRAWTVPCRLYPVPSCAAASCATACMSACS